MCNFWTEMKWERTRGIALSSPWNLLELYQSTYYMPGTSLISGERMPEPQHCSLGGAHSTEVNIKIYREFHLAPVPLPIQSQHLCVSFFPGKFQPVNTFGFESYMVSIEVTQLCHGRMKEPWKKYKPIGGWPDLVCSLVCCSLL